MMNTIERSRGNNDHDVQPIRLQSRDERRREDLFYGHVYATSPKEADEFVALLQGEVNDHERALEGIDCSDMHAVIDWCYDYLDLLSKTPGAKLDKAGVIATFQEYGFTVGANTGESFDADDLENYARFIVEQILGELSLEDTILSEAGLVEIDRWYKKFGRRFKYSDYYDDDDLDHRAPGFVSLGELEDPASLRRDILSYLQQIGHTASWPARYALSLSDENRLLMIVGIMTISTFQAIGQKNDLCELLELRDPNRELQAEFSSRIEDPDLRDAYQACVDDLQTRVKKYWDDKGWFRNWYQGE